MSNTIILQRLLEEFYQRIKQLDLKPRTAQFPKVPNKIKVAIGMRRTGKTYFLYQSLLQLLNEGVPLTRILYLNFEDDRLLPLNSEKMVDLLEAFYEIYPENHTTKCYLFLDEIQNVDNWALVIRRFYDSKQVEIYLTGSSAKLLSKEIATSLRGRSLATEIWPYSLDEYLRAKNIETNRELFGKATQDKLMQQLDQYLHEGGFPEVIDYSVEIRQKTLQEYVDIVIYRDIIERHKVTHTSIIKYMILTMIHNVAKPFSINKFYNDLKSQGYRINKDSLYDDAEHIEDAFLAFSVPIYSKSLRKIQSNPKKVYAIDTGLINALTLHIGDFGKVFENLVYLDLRRKGYSIYYYLTADRYEVDFLVQNNQGKKKLIQVVWEVNDPATLEREQRALIAAQQELNIEGVILTPFIYLKEGVTI